MIQTAYWYLHTDQYRYDTFSADALSSARAGGAFSGMAMVDVLAKWARLGWMPSYPIFDRSSLTLADDVEAAGVPVDKYVPAALKDGSLTFAGEDPDERYARRMNIEQRLAESIRSFGLDALAGAVPLHVDLDVTLTVLAHTLSSALRRRLPGYTTTTPDTLQRRFLSTTGEILNQGNDIIVRLDRRTYSPVLRQADLPTTEVPWWGGRRLSHEYR